MTDDSAGSLPEDDKPGDWLRKMAVAGVLVALMVLIPIGMAWGICSCLKDLCEEGN